MENIFLNSKKHLGRKQVILDCKFNIDSGKEVDKILSVQSTPIIVQTSCIDGRITYSGKLDTSLLYITTNGEKISLIAVSDFSEIFENNEINEESLAVIDCKLVDITTPSIKTNEIKVACIVDVNISTITNKEIETNYDEEEFITKKNLTNISKHLCIINDNFDINEELKLEDTLNQILKIDYNLSLKDSFCGNGYITIEAECLACITYEDENDNIKSFKSHFPIKQEIECNNATSECVANLNIKALSYLAKIVVTQASSYNIIKCDIPLQVIGNVYESTQISKIEDAYSTSNVISCNFEDITAITSSQNLFYEDTCKGIVPIKEDTQNVKVLSVLNSNCEVANYTLENDKLNIEGIVSATILYEEETKINDEETKKIITPAITEFAFTSSTNANKLKNCNNINIHCGINDIDIKSLNNEFEIVSKLNFWLSGTTEENIHILKDISTISARPKPDCAIQIFFAEKNQNIWELAKEIGLSKEEILKQNPQLNDNIEQGSKIIIYNKI